MFLKKHFRAGTWKRGLLKSSLKTGPATKIPYPQTKIHTHYLCQILAMKAKEGKKLDEKTIFKIWDAYNKAAPHLNELLWLKNEINSLISNTQNLDMFINALNQKIQEEKIIPRKTDLKIFISYLTSKQP